MSAPVEPILRVRDLRTYFFTRRGVGRAVDGVSFDLNPGETLGLIGESGCGKSVACLSLLRLNPTPSSRIVGGEVLFRGDDLLQMTHRELRAVRGRHISMVLQDPLTALNPVLSIGAQIGEPLRLHQRLRGAALRARAIELLRLLKVSDPAERLSAFPHQLSGGMRQRVVGAIALSCSPQILIADEPTTALDVTVQAAYLKLLKGIQRDTGLSILFVTHDFSVVARMCDRVAVMYAGKIVEIADTATILSSPKHPYTEALLRSVPDLKERPDRLYSIEGAPPSIFSPHRGCPFAVRCAYVQDRCHVEYPPERTFGAGHSAFCWVRG